MKPLPVVAKGCLLAASLFAAASLWAWLWAPELALAWTYKGGVVAMAAALALAMDAHRNRHILPHP